MQFYKYGQDKIAKATWDQMLSSEVGMTLSNYKSIIRCR